MFNGSEIFFSRENANQPSCQCARAIRPAGGGGGDADVDVFGFDDVHDCPYFDILTYSPILARKKKRTV